MTTHPTPDPSDRPEHRKRSQLPITVFLLSFILFSLVAAGLYWLGTKSEQVIPDAAAPSQQTPSIKTDTINGQPDEQQLASKASGSNGQPALKTDVPKDTNNKDRVTNTQQVGAAAGISETPECQPKVGHDLAVFFKELDEREYIEEQNLSLPTQQYFIQLADTLLANPPVVSREADDLYTLLKNMAHFFRIIGKKNILLLKSILDREREKIEDIAADLYLWIEDEKCRSDELAWQPKFTAVYEYAGFFINTMSGRSYMFRRDSRSRLLVNYYAVKLIDRANEKGMNGYGIDISGFIPLLMQEIEATNQLIYKEDYIDQLLHLQEKYQ
jgi:hypothetical protein